MTGVEALGNIILGVLIFVSIIMAWVMFANGTPIAENECIIAQSGIIRDMKNKIDEARMRNIKIPYSLEILDCVRCMWYEKDGEKLMVVYSISTGLLSREKIMNVSYKMSTNFVKVGCDCNDCNNNDGNSPPKYCANLRNDKIYLPYQFDINKTHSVCLNCQETYKECQTAYKNCGCPSSLCKILDCGDSLTNISLDVAGEEKYFQYILTAPKNVEINLTTDNGDLYHLAAMWENKTCPGSGIRWNCIDGGRTQQVCAVNNLQPGIYNIKVSRYGYEPLVYNLSLTCS